VRLPPLSGGRILRRYKRFLADVELDEGGVVTAHCPNTGAMTTCWSPGAPVQLSFSDNPKRKLAWTLERVDMGHGWVGVHTGRTNPVIAEAILARGLAGFEDAVALQSEPRFEVPRYPASRFDLLVTHDDGRRTYVEVKNTTLLSGNTVRFPDAVTERGRKHLELLMRAVDLGFGGVVVFAVNRPEGNYFEPAVDIDPKYAATLERATQHGVGVLVTRLRHTGEGINVGGYAWY